MASPLARVGGLRRIHRDRSRWEPATRLVLALMVLLPVSACSDPAQEQLAAEQTIIAEALAAGDHSAALHGARGALREHPGAPALCLSAAEACIGLERYDEAVTYAETGLPGAEGDETLTTDLYWAKGKAHLALFLQLQSAEDWRTANSDLERGTSAAGTHRADAAYALARMQGLGGNGSDGRRDKFGRLFLSLEPTGERADKMSQLMDGGGAR